ncbi:hypothetical protein I6F65_07285 [Pseudoalteromonas sp. SWXJZ94C]|uniref:hypothetical protein n=1 Tax=Pseudoalteromonas sp. SWXJZ94C TaxID=2792065 RepID=UPI0018CDB3EA|nr:hypothetical protein [Pseudoalteromonas sp. SWXJZ94C]MBH0056760.1 hypothetical protein [Pseudoalteromonas sp. SWXJZ94C]
MNINEFCINNEFFCGGKKWRCTDIGTRVVIAICVSECNKDRSWLNGPPYAVVESVFDEDDQLACVLNESEQ